MAVQKCSTTTPPPFNQLFEHSFSCHNLNSVDHDFTESLEMNGVIKVKIDSTLTSGAVHLTGILPP